MFEIIAVTNRLLCKTDFLTQLGRIAETNVSRIILREKDLLPKEYELLAQKAIKLCGERLVPHYFAQSARDLGARRLHLPLFELEANPWVRDAFEAVGVSVHSMEEAKRAEALGAGYVTAGHIFATDCKKGAAPRGTAFLERLVCELTIPVYAIGGINAQNIREIKSAGAQGACLMSAFMNGDPKALMGFTPKPHQR